MLPTASPTFSATVSNVVWIASTAPVKSPFSSAVSVSTTPVMTANAVSNASPRFARSGWIRSSAF